MNKELTPLKAFYKIIDMAHEPNGYQNFTNGCDTPYTKIVETALKRYDSLEFIAVDIEQDNKALIKENNKLKRVLDIIKEKRVNVGNFIHWLKSTTNPTYKSYLSDYYQEGWDIHFNDGVSKEYDNSLCIETYCLTQEDYDLLKEVLE